ncbi:metal-dependent hydrolase [Bordetella genomosp. 13]|uniref:Hydrolase n=1 Tax=Bordetella genomosp. 13 TaxID=463040 RepID=A0A1W6ZBT8_9BORD|nr:metal-dependent hydrolase [Bordetella genomosp. 13]ARP94620.1 hydrolase [Bordetella genomosp. 13]
MDSITQAVLGAGIQGALMGRFQGRKALLYGAALGTLPDLDVLVRYADPVSSMTYHRGFSHSVFVLTALAGGLAWLVRKRWPQAPYGAGRLFLAIWLVLFTHPVLDAFTVYGTQLFWPLTWTPESWSAVFIIDPVYTVPMLLAVLAAALFGLTAGMRRAVAVTVLFGGLYLLAGLAGRWHAEQRVQDELARQGVQVERVLGTPMPFNTLLWRVVAIGSDGAYYEGISGWFDRAAPETLRLPRHPELADALADAPLHARLRWFTDDWLRYDALGDALVVTDLRMGIPGYYTFRFVMAERGADGAWHAVTPRRWPSARGGGPELRRMMDRIAQGLPLPLASWSEQALR